MTDYFDITENVNQVKESVKDIRDVNECCNYRHQILDKFCASKNAVS